jgi:hypothetical protein
MGGPPDGEVVYKEMQVWSTPHPDQHALVIHFQTREITEQMFKISLDAARRLVKELRGQIKRLERKSDSR